MYAKITKFQSVYTNQPTRTCTCYLGIPFNQFHTNGRTNQDFKQPTNLGTFHFSDHLQSVTHDHKDGRAFRQTSRRTDRHTQPVELARQTGSW